MKLLILLAKKVLRKKKGADGKACWSGYRHAGSLKASQRPLCIRSYSERAKLKGNSLLQLKLGA